MCQLEALEGQGIHVPSEVLRRFARQVDQENRFPYESLDALQDAGLNGFFVPRPLGGRGGSARSYASIAAALGADCLSTAIIWAMHCQQVAILARTPMPDAEDLRDDVLRRVAHQGDLVASVTTSSGPPSDLLKPRAALAEDGEQIRLERTAPIVSYGREAAFFLVTMKPTTERGEPVLALVTRDDGAITAEGGWHAMGMRGTQSQPMHFDVHIDRDRILGRSLTEISAETLVPVGHLGWAAAWYGAALGAFRRTVARLRTLGAERRRDLRSDSLRHRLADLRVSLDLLGASVDTTARRLDGLWSRQAPPESYRDIAFNVQINSLKIASSRLSFAVIDGLMEICGLFEGYLEEAELGLERVFRDLRSASLMYGNERLLQANGNLIFIEGGTLSHAW